MSETQEDYALAVGRLKTALQGCLETARSLADGTHLPEMLREALGGVALANGSVAALSAEGSDAWEARLIEALAIDAQHELDEAQRAEAALLGHLIERHPQWMRARCRCGWEGDPHSVHSHVSAVLEETNLIRAAEVGHRLVIVDGTVMCACGWVPEHAGLALQHLWASMTIRDWAESRDAPVAPVGKHFGFRLTAMCDTCGVRRRGLVLGEDREEAGELVAAVSQGWTRLHEGHAEAIVASPFGPDVESAP